MILTLLVVVLLIAKEMDLLKWHFIQNKAAGVAADGAEDPDRAVGYPIVPGNKC